MVELGTHLAYRKSECWKLSAYSCARHRSIPTALYRTMDMTFWLPQAEAALAQVA